MRIRLATALTTAAVAGAALPALLAGPLPMGAMAGTAAAATQARPAQQAVGPICPLHHRCPPLPQPRPCHTVPGHWQKELNWSGRPYVWVPAHTVCRDIGWDE